ncbi:MAG: fused DSP-PTPase phosphatase/NAD kinase-like protein, partial [Planctomycetota bacterium]
MRTAYILPFLLAFAAACCGDGTAPPPKDPDFAQPVEVDGIPNVAKIHDGIYRGGQPGKKGYLWLKEQGFKTVVNFRRYHDETEKVEAQGLKAVWLPMDAGAFGSTPPTDEQLKQFFGIILDPALQPVYFHCAHGSDRTGTMGAIYRMEVDGW